MDMTIVCVSSCVIWYISVFIFYFYFVQIVFKYYLSFSFVQRLTPNKFGIDFTFFLEPFKYSLYMSERKYLEYESLFIKWYTCDAATSKHHRFGPSGECTASRANSTDFESTFTGHGASGPRNSRQILFTASFTADCGNVFIRCTDSQNL